MSRRRTNGASAKKIRNLEQIVLCGTLIMTPLALGGRSTALNLGIALVLTVCAITTQILGSRQSSRTPLEWLIATLCVATGLQLLPLPPSLLKTLSPQAWDIWQFHGVAPDAWAPISTAPAQTLKELLILCNYLLFTFIAQSFCKNRGAKEKLQLVVVSTGAFIACLAVVQNILGFTSPFNLPNHFPELFPTTFDNSNHAGAFLGVASLVGMGLTLAAHPSRQKIYGALTFLATCGVFLSMSRGAIIAWLFTAMVAAFVLMKRESEKVSGSTTYALIIGSVVLFIAVGLLAFEDLVAEMSTVHDELNIGESSKLSIWESAPQMILSYPWTGVGKGAFQTNFTRFMTVDNSATWVYLENGWLQVLVDWGLVLGGLVLLGFSLLWLRASRDLRHQVKYLGPLSGLLFLAIHNNSDFNLEMTSVGLIALVCFLSVQVTRKSKKPRSPSWRFQVYPALLMAASAATSAGVLNVSLGQDLNSTTSQLQHLMRHSNLDWDTRLSSAEALVAKYPADYYLHEVIAEQALAEKKYAQALRWVNKAMYLNGKSNEAHLIAARTLHKLNYKNQALLEYRLAVKALPHRAGKIAQEMLDQGSPVETVLKLNQYNTDVVDIGRVLLDAGHAQAVLQSNPGDSPDELELRAMAQERLGQTENALNTARQLEGIAPKRFTGYRIQVDALMALENCEEAITVNDRAYRSVNNQHWLHTQKVAALVACKRFDEAVNHAQTTLWTGKTNSQKAASQYHLGNAFTGLQQYQRAQEAYAQASLQDPRVYYWQAWIKTLEQLGQRGRVQKALSQAPEKIRKSAWYVEKLKSDSSR